MVRKSFAIKHGRYFAAAGWGRYGPYAVGTYRRGRGVAKVTVGTRGGTIGGRIRVYRKVRVGATLNLTHHRHSLSLRTRRRIYRL
ncbi:MAG TPA: hypothetical protein VNE86_02180 [Nitrososphaerales archaeon]|nr:hypothetical protein [Nitrososphaerales archaeon]